MPTAKFKLEDQVIKKNLKGICLSLGKNSGKVIEVLERPNKKGTICYYYGVKWPDGRRSEHAQHILVPAP